MPSHPFVPIPNTARVEMIFNQAGEFIENVYHVSSNTPFTFALLQTLRGVFDNWDNTTAKLQRIGACSLIRIRTRALDSENGATEDYNLVLGRVGTIGGTALPLNSTFAVKLSTDQAGRSYRGRVYMVGLSTSHLADSASLSATARDNLVSTLNTLRTVITAANAAWHLCVASTYTDGAWRATGVCTTITNAVATNLDLDSQRRRLRGRGHA